MKFDIFFSICQTEVNGWTPTEREMFENFFDQVRWADQLGYETAWVAETHLSCQIQKQNQQPVIPNFSGEIGLNTDILQLAHRVFSQTERIHVGSAIRNIVCNGGPIAHAESIRMFLSLHSLSTSEKRLLEIGFANGRFPFSNMAYGIFPRDDFEKEFWPAVRNKVFHEATEKFLRFLKGECFSSADIEPRRLCESDFHKEGEWNKAVQWHHQTYRAQSKTTRELELKPFWIFEKVGLVPVDVSLELLRLTIGTHDPSAQIMANQIMPCGVFNLSITPSHVIEETHARMNEHYFYRGQWKRRLMPRTVLVFLDATKNCSAQEQKMRARQKAADAISIYWKAMEGTIDPVRIESAVNNAVFGNPQQILLELQNRYHPDDRLMLWFDFNNHDSQDVKKSMQLFASEARQ